MGQQRKYKFEFIGGIDNSFVFRTDNQIIYEIKFKDSSYIFLGYSSIKIEAYEMSTIVFHNPTNRHPPLDPRVSVTIAAIFRDFFSQNNEKVIVYICDSSDNRQAARHRKFSQWLELFGDEFIQLDAQITDNKQVVFFASLILHSENPLRQEITEAFFNLISKQNK